MSKWQEFGILPRVGTLPNKPCVYAVYFDGRLVYVGQTNRLQNRFCEHKFRHGYGKEIITPWGDVPGTTRVTIKVGFSIRYGDWAMREIRLIHRLKPVLNQHHRISRKGAL